MHLALVVLTELRTAPASAVAASQATHHALPSSLCHCARCTVYSCMSFHTQGELRWFLALSIFWALYNMIPPSLFLFYLFKSDGIFEDYCSFCFVASFLLGIGGIVCTWLVPGGCVCVLTHC